MTTPTADAGLIAENLGKQFGDLWALREPTGSPTTVSCSTMDEKLLLEVRKN